MFWLQVEHDGLLDPDDQCAVLHPSIRRKVGTPPSITRCSLQTLTQLLHLPEQMDLGVHFGFGTLPQHA